MARVKRGVTSHAKHKKVFKATKGHYGRRRNTIRIAKQSMEKAMQYAYRDRKTKKRRFVGKANRHVPRVKMRPGRGDQHEPPSAAFGSVTP